MFGGTNDNNGQDQAQGMPTSDEAIGTPGVNATPGAPAAPAGLGSDSAGQLGEAPADNNAAVSAPAARAGGDDLLDIKQQALQQLSPLVGHLDQTPEEEFRTTMMMIQASDNKDLVQKAFEAAQKIQDEKSRAQALLDIVNEINYFTQHSNEAEENK